MISQNWVQQTLTFAKNILLCILRVQLTQIAIFILIYNKRRMNQELLLLKWTLKEEIKKQILEDMAFQKPVNYHTKDQFAAFKANFSSDLQEFAISIAQIKKSIKKLQTELEELKLQKIDNIPTKQTSRRSEQNLSIKTLKKQNDHANWLQDKIQEMLADVEMGSKEDYHVQQTQIIKVSTRKSLKTEESPNEGQETDQPKKPKNTFLIFKDEVYKYVKEKNPDKKPNEIMKMIGQMWKQCDPGTKARIEAEYQTNKTKYESEISENQDSLLKYSKKKKN